MPNLDALHDNDRKCRRVDSIHAALMCFLRRLGLSAVAALMYLTQERNLKFHKLQAFSLMRRSSVSKRRPCAAAGGSVS